MWTDLTGKTYEDLVPYGGIYIGGGYMIQCHYHPQSQDRELYNLARRTGLQIIALPEQSGVFVQDNAIIVKGTKPVCVFEVGQKTRYGPESSIPGLQKVV